MAEPGLILVTGAGGGVGGVGGKVVALLRQRGLAVRAMAHHADAAPMPCARSAPTSSSVISRARQMSRRPSIRSNGCSSA